MSIKDKILRKVFQKGMPRNVSKQELDTLMAQCGCLKGQGGRGSGVRFIMRKREESWPSMNRILRTICIRIRLSW